MAKRVSNHAIRDVAAAAARLSLRQTRTWCAPARTDARPTMEAINAIGMNTTVTTFPAARHKSIQMAMASCKYGYGFLQMWLRLLANVAMDKRLVMDSPI